MDHVSSSVRRVERRARREAAVVRPKTRRRVTTGGAVQHWAYQSEEVEQGAAWVETVRYVG